MRRLIYMVPITFHYAIVAAFLTVTVSAISWAQSAADADTLAKARELMTLYERQDAMGDFLDRSVIGISTALEQQNSGKTDEIDELVTTKFLPMVRARLPEFYESVAAVYAEHFTSEELQELIEFFGTATGQKFAKERWAMTAETYVLGVRWTSKVAHEVLEELTPELRKRGLKISLD